MKNRILVSLAGAGIAGSLLISSVAFADTNSTTPPQNGSGRGGPGMGRMMWRAPGVFGTVASVSGNTLSVTSKAGPNGTPAASTYTVDASSATVVKNGATSSVSAIAVGDTVMVQGTVTGTSVVAKIIRDGIPAMGAGKKEGRPQGQNALTPLIQGNGKPVIGGSISAISGSTLTVVTAQGGITYSVDASSAIVQKGNATSSVAGIAVGDRVVVQGTVNGTSVTATSVIDQGSASTGSSSENENGMMGERLGFMGALRGLLQHLFGFF